MASLLTYRIPLPEDPETTVRFTLYSEAPEAFNDHALWLGGILASHCALTTNREIGAATGALMASHSKTYRRFTCLKFCTRSSEIPDHRRATPASRAWR